jgi:cell division septal protein FtsQ
MYATARETSMFAVRSFVVEGAPAPVAAEVRAVLQRFSGTSLLALNGAAVLRAVDDLPTVVSAQYDRSFPHELRVRVVAETPVAVVRRGNGAWLASARGRIIAAIPRRRYRSLPRIWLPGSTKLAIGNFLAGDAAASARALRAFVDSRFAHRVLWARVADGRLALRLHSGLAVNFGAPTSLPLKIAVVRSILPTLAAPRAGGPSYLDLSVPERPVAGRDPQPEG